MDKIVERIHLVDLNQVKLDQFKQCNVSCLVLTRDSKILLQQRGEDWERFPAFLATFGGRIESGERPMQALVREMYEELGAQVVTSDIVELGAVTDAITNHSELVYCYFWHDRHGTITGCYEGEAKQYGVIEDIFVHPKLMDVLVWLLHVCQEKNLLQGISIK